MGQNFVVLTLNRLFYFKLFLIVLASFAVRIWLIDQFASPVPYWDQWDAEAVYTFIPWFDGNLTIGNLIAPHNEHRLFFTRISSLGLLILNDMQWDPWVQMVFCAGLAILNLWVLALILKQLLGERGYNVSLFAVAGLTSQLVFVQLIQFNRFLGSITAPRRFLAMGVGHDMCTVDLLQLSVWNFRRGNAVVGKKLSVAD